MLFICSHLIDVFADVDFTRLRKGNSSSEPEANWNATANIPPPTVKPRNMFTRNIWDAPIGTKMPELKSFRLTKEILEHRAKDNIIIMTFGNHAYMDFILTWVKHLTDLNVYNLLVGNSHNSVEFMLPITKAILP